MATTERTVRAEDGAQLAVSIHGEGTPLLLIPGLGATRAVFNPLLPGLVRRHRVVVYDPRGVGGSDTGAQELAMPLLARDAVAVLRQTDAFPADVLGASMGGVVAQHVAVHHPEAVAHLVLAATGPGGRAVPPDPRAAAALMGRGARTPEEAYRQACTVLYSPHFQRTHPDFIEAQVRLRAANPVRAAVFSAQARALRQGQDVAARLGEVAAPTLVLHGSADVITPLENAEMLAARIPHARLRWFADCGHLFFHERPEESARVVDEFLRDLS